MINKNIGDTRNDFSELKNKNTIIIICYFLYLNPPILEKFNIQLNV